MKVVQSWQKS